MKNRKEEILEELTLAPNKLMLEDVEALDLKSENSSKIKRKIVKDHDHFLDGNFTSAEDEDPPHYFGHRQRVKEQFLNSNPESFADYELLEILLFSAIPRKDVKPIAKKLLSIFGSLNDLLYAGKDKLLKIPGVNKGVCLNILLVREFIQRSLKDKVIMKNVISSWSALLDYLKLSMGSVKLEQLRILFLNKKNILIADEVMAIGTIDQAPVYPREIIKKALFYEAGAIILVHNHPSGNPKPSTADIELTERIVAACSMMNITMHDHVIIAGSEYYSFKSNMLL